MTTTNRNAGHVRWPLWGLLIFCGAISLTLSVMHALAMEEAGDTKGMVAGFIVGVAPVVAAAFLAELVADPYASTGLKLGVGTVFLGGMALSVNAQQAVVLPFVDDNRVLAILFPLVMDLSTIMALLALAGVGYSLNKELQKEELRAEILPEVERELEREFRQELAAREEELRAELERNKTEELAAREEELRAELEGNFGTELAEREQEIRQELVARIQAAEEEIRARAESEMQERIQDAVIAAEARVRLELTKNGTGGKRPQKEISAAGKTGGDQQPNKRDRAASILRAQPDITPKDLAVMLDCTPKYARNLINELAPEPGNGPDETPGEEVRLRAVP